MAPFDENAPLPTSYNTVSINELPNMASSGIPTFPTRTRTLGTSTSGKRIIPKRSLRTTSLAIPEDASSNATAKRCVTKEDMGQLGVLGESRGGGNIDRSVPVLQRQTGEKGISCSGKDVSAVYDRRLRVLEAGVKAREKKDNEKFEELNATIADLRAELALRSAPAVPTATTVTTVPTALLASTSLPVSEQSFTAETPRTTQSASRPTQAILSTPTRAMLPARLAQNTFDLSEFGAMGRSGVAGVTGSPPVPAVLSRQKRQSMLGSSRMADISASVLGTSTSDKRGRGERRPMSLEEDLSMSEMSFADLVEMGDEMSAEDEEEEKGGSEREPELEPSPERVSEAADVVENEDNGSGHDVLEALAVHAEGLAQSVWTGVKQDSRKHSEEQGAQLEMMASKIRQVEQEIEQLKAHVAEAEEAVIRLTARAEAAEVEVQALHEAVAQNRAEMENMHQALRDMQAMILEKSASASTSTVPYSLLAVLLAIVTAAVFATLRGPAIFA